MTKKHTFHYIHLNPLRAGIVKSIDELNRYAWSGHRTIIGKSKHPWMDGDYVLAQFGNNRRKVLHEYRFDRKHFMGLVGIEMMHP